MVRSRIVTLRDAGYGWRYIRRVMAEHWNCHVSLRGMIKIYKKYKETNSVDDVPRSGRPCCKTRFEDGIMGKRLMDIFKN